MVVIGIDPCCWVLMIQWGGSPVRFPPLFRGYTVWLVKSAIFYHIVMHASKLGRESNEVSRTCFTLRERPPHKNFWVVHQISSTPTGTPTHARDSTLPMPNLYPGPYLRSYTQPHPLAYPPPVTTQPPYRPVRGQLIPKL